MNPKPQQREQRLALRRRTEVDGRPDGARRLGGHDEHGIPGPLRQARGGVKRGPNDRHVARDDPGSMTAAVDLRERREPCKVRDQKGHVALGQGEVRAGRRGHQG
jgi:hypothetical protein